MIKQLQIGDLTARFPVIQGGMGVGVSLSGLAGAVAAQGGIGIISTAQIGYREPDYQVNPHTANLRAVKKEIRRAKELAAGGIVGVVSFFIGIPGPLYGIINVDLSLMIAYLVSAAALVIFSTLDKDGKKVHA